jgi:glucose/arabinose dehydrogenase
MRTARLSAIMVILAISAPRAATLPAGFTETQVTAALSNATAMQFAPDGRLFIAEQGGRLRVVKDGALLPTPFLTVTVDSSGERGLLGVAFDPAFASNRFVYVYYTATTPTIHNRISRFTANGDTAVAGSETIVLELDNLSGATNHNGGALSFGPDGKLYAAVGENANGANSQTLGNLLGKMLRLNADGSIPTDNPFFNSTTGRNRAIWALGLRNPFTFAFNAAGGQLFINDVGQNTWEEIDDGVAGANYGWPETEGATADPRFRSPRYTYNHSTPGVCAITGGVFYSPLTPQFPAEYAQDYFFADFCGGWIRRLDVATGTVTTFATGIASPVDLKVSDDGALYYLARGANALYRIGYGTAAPTITSHPANQTVQSGARVTFSVGASGPPPLRYQWRRNGVDIPGATAPDYSFTATAADNGARFRAQVTNDGGNVLSNEAVLTVSPNQAPTPTITQPTAGTLYSGGMVINYAGTATDPEDGTLGAGAFTWRVDFHHDTHTHPFVASTTGATSGSFTIPTLGETAANVWYRISLTVTDSAGVARTTERDILPRLARLTLATNPAGLQVRLDGQPVATPVAFDSVVGIVRNIEAVTPQASGGSSYSFMSWSDGGAVRHDVSTPAAATTYTATFGAATPAPGPIHVNFQLSSAPVPAGYLKDGGLVYGDRGNGYSYGWNADNTAQMRDRDSSLSPDQRYDTLAYMQRPANPDAVWEIAVPNGTYLVHAVAGDAAYFDAVYRIAAEGVLTVNGISNSASRWIEGTATVTVSDGRLTIRSAPGSTDANKICFVDITPEVAPPPPPVLAPIRVNFQLSSAPVPAGYLKDGGLVYGDRGNGQSYGWNADNTAQMRDRDSAASPDQRYDTLAYMQRPANPDAVWEIAVPNGSYVVRAVAGDPAYFDLTYLITVEGVLTVNGTSNSSSRWVEGTVTVTVSDGRLTIRSAPGTDANKICFVEITPQ